jgi:hypothetical protein
MADGSLLAIEISLLEKAKSLKAATHQHTLYIKQQELTKRIHLYEKSSCFVFTTRKNLRDFIFFLIFKISTGKT